MLDKKTLCALVLACATLVVVGKVLLDPYQRSMVRALDTVRSAFPRVPRIQTKELADWLGDPNRPPPVLLDVRTRPEWVEEGFF